MIMDMRPITGNVIYYTKQGRFEIDHKSLNSKILTELHREDGPAIEYPNGDLEWYRNGKLHRADGPACICADGTKSWHYDGDIHRLDGPACEDADGTLAWYVNGILHRADGPAVIYPTSSREWFKYGQRHREDGPAVEANNGRNYWFWADKEITQLEHFYKSPYWRTLSKEEQLHYLLSIGVT